MQKLQWTAWVILAVVVATAKPGSADPAKDLRSKDYVVRLKAVAAIRAAGGDGAEKLLVSALKDKDWEVVERAVEALADHGGEKALKALVKVAVQGPVRRIRNAAAATVARLGSEEAAKRISKSLRRDSGARAAEALAVIAKTILAETKVDAAGEREQLIKALDKALKWKLASVRAAAAGAIGVFPAEERVERIEELLTDKDLTVVAATLDSLPDQADLGYFPAVTTLLTKPRLEDVLARRAVAAILAFFDALEPDQQAEAERLLGGLVDKASNDPVSASRVASLLGSLGSVPTPKETAPEEAAPGKQAPKKKSGKDAGKKKDDPPPSPAKPLLAPEVCLGLLRAPLRLESEAARAAAVEALKRIGTVEAIDLAATLLEDPHHRVRFQVLDAIVAGRGLGEERTLKHVTDALANDPHVSVREEAALLLGRPDPKGKPFEAPVEALAKALSDASWAVAVVAAVSLGKTRAPSAVDHLAGLLDRKTVKDWRLRGAGVVGLGKVQQRAAVPHLILALKDRDKYVRRSAYEFLKRLTKRRILDDPAEWTAWWKHIGPKYEFEDREEADRVLKQGGYAVKPADVYNKGKETLDVVVLKSRGDHIEQLLDRLRIPYRITRAAQVDEADMHSFAVFISNCTGEVQKDDVERLQWFVRVGGYLFGSCWALQHTVELVYPGLVQKLPTKGEVLDNVVAEACPGDSPFLKDVFRPWTQPIYVLFGAHLIQVLQPERVEVLIDSPQAAAHWGGGNMACWFSAGHGVILDSANHFDLQGLERVNGLKTAEDRMAYAMDHCGLDYKELRELAAQRIWERQADAVKSVRDLSAFRFITNFARLKRKTDP